MKMLESFLTRLALVSVLPIGLFLAGWWSSVGRMRDDQVIIPALCGLAWGILLDVALLRKQIAKPYEVNPWIIAFIFLFYSVCTLGFFMGVPVFNLVTGAALGLYVGRRLRHSGADRAGATRTINLASIFTAVVSAGVCSASAYWALRDPMDTASNLQGMLGIRSFEVTTWMVVALIAVGGPVLVYIQYRITKAAAAWAYK